MNVCRMLQGRLAEALAGLADPVAEYAAMIKPAQNPAHGDYQANCAMALAKKLGKSPRDVAQLIVGRLDISGVCDPPEVAGQGFINLRLGKEWLDMSNRPTISCATSRGDLPSFFA